MHESWGLVMLSRRKRYDVSGAHRAPSTRATVKSHAVHRSLAQQTTAPKARPVPLRVPTPSSHPAGPRKATLHRCAARDAAAPAAAAAAAAALAAIGPAAARPASSLAVPTGAPDPWTGGATLLVFPGAHSRRAATPHDILASRGLRGVRGGEGKRRRAGVLAGADRGSKGGDGGQNPVSPLTGELAARGLKGVRGGNKCGGAFVGVLFTAAGSSSGESAAAHSALGRTKRDFGCDWRWRGASVFGGRGCRFIDI